MEPSDIIDAAIDSDAVGVQKAVDELMKAKVAAVLSNLKVDVAKNLFNQEA